MEEQTQRAIESDELSDEELREIVAIPWREDRWQSPFIRPSRQVRQAADEHAALPTLKAYDMPCSVFLGASEGVVTNILQLKISV